VTRPSYRKIPATAAIWTVTPVTVIRGEISGVPYGKIETDPETGFPRGLGLDTITGFSMLMQDNKNHAVFAPKGREAGVEADRNNYSCHGNSPAPSLTEPHVGKHTLFGAQTRQAAQRLPMVCSPYPCWRK
jgi:hypothetical protein